MKNILCLGLLSFATTFTAQAQLLRVSCVDMAERKIADISINFDSGDAFFNITDPNGYSFRLIPNHVEELPSKGLLEIYGSAKDATGKLTILEIDSRDSKKRFKSLLAYAPSELGDITVETDVLCLLSDSQQLSF